MREPERLEKKAEALARKFLGACSSSLSRAGARKTTRKYIEQHEHRKSAILCEMVETADEKQIPPSAKAEIIRRIKAWREPIRKLTGPNPRDLEFRQYVICCVIQGIRQLGIDATRRREGIPSACYIVANVLAEFDAKPLSEQTVRDTWQARKTIEAWSEDDAIAWIKYGPFAGRN